MIVMNDSNEGSSQMGLLEHIQQYGAPIVDGNQVLFVWQGETAPYLKTDFNSWSEAIPLEPADDGLWTATVTLPSTDAYFEYIFFDDPDDEKSRRMDPFNRHKVTNGMGKYNNYVRMGKNTATPYARPRKNAPKGTVIREVIEHWSIHNQQRELWLYSPPTDEPVPLLMVWDGKDYYKRAKITTIVDNLIADKKIPPIAIAMLQNGKQARWAEYYQGEVTLGYFGQLVLPLAQQHLNLLDYKKHPGAYGVAGASMGGLMALYTGLRLPHIFGKVISQSGAFFNELFDGEPTLTETLVKTTQPKLKIWQDVGTLEWLLTGNRAMNQLLRDRKYDVTYHEYEGGHNYTCWQDMLPQALMTTFG